MSFRVWASSFAAPTKLVPLSECGLCAVPPSRKLIKRRKTLMKLSVMKEVATSRWVARDARQVSTTHQCLSSLRPSLMKNGPKKSIPVFVKGTLFWREAILREVSNLLFADLAIELPAGDAFCYYSAHSSIVTQ